MCDVQIISNVQFNGNGGESNLLCFISQNPQTQRKDTLQYFNDVTSTDDIKRKRMLKHLQIGLLPYLVEKGHADIIEVNIKHDEMQKTHRRSKIPGSNGSFQFPHPDFSMETKTIVTPISITVSPQVGKLRSVSLVSRCTTPSTGGVSIFTILSGIPPKW